VPFDKAQIEKEKIPVVHTVMDIVSPINDGAVYLAAETNPTLIPFSSRKAI